MKLFNCGRCGQLLFFENTVCGRCGTRIGYLAESSQLVAVDPLGGDAWRPVGWTGDGYRFCDNAADQACNWLVPEFARERFCLACRHNRVIPELRPDTIVPWQRTQTAKNRLFYSLIRLGLPRLSRAEDPQHGLAFDVLEERAADGCKVLTGHEDGLITLNLREADDVERERVRSRLGEFYRTMLGHMRHEVGHYYWDVLVQRGGRLDDFRALFGDEREDYAGALQRHYAKTRTLEWTGRFISDYASSHPWEDFAETWAHYLHIVDTLETARSFGLRLGPEPGLGLESADFDFDPYGNAGLPQMIAAWGPLAVSANGLNRSMGQPDLYPFVLYGPVVEKLAFVHELVHPAGPGG